ncbi:MAG TPA: hypothetical protein EYQ31_07455, partial [Candidatus Handelsmanbacteria bacterium]|nr:hypothetical protein [Candidatus Handelsmanbacteria bacterium]
MTPAKPTSRSVSAIAEVSSRAYSNRDSQLDPNMKSPRVAIGSILTECNQFGGSPIDLDWFERYELLWGDDMLDAKTGVVGGALALLTEAGADIAPLLSASTCPGGSITADCYHRLRTELLDRLQAALPVEGVLLPLHGAAVAEGVDDPEGDLISAVRQLVGRDIALVATLDLHAHVTRAMVENAHGLVAWETYPHRDAQSTGARGAQLLLDTIAGKCRPAMALAKVPVIVGGLRGSTDGDGAFARIMRAAKAHEAHGDILSASVFLVHPFLDQPDLGGGGLYITDGDASRSRALAVATANDFWAARHELEAHAVAPAEAIGAGLAIDGGPVVLVEAADCAGGGASGDSVATLRALLEREPAPDALVPVVDPVVEPVVAPETASEDEASLIKMIKMQMTQFDDQMKRILEMERQKDEQNSKKLPESQENQRKQMIQLDELMKRMEMERQKEEENSKRNREMQENQKMQMIQEQMERMEERHRMEMERREARHRSEMENLSQQVHF